MHTNHIAWLVWHMARVEDSWISRLLGGTTQVWTAEGWADRFQMDPEGTGSGHASEDVRAMPEIPLSDLMAYFEAVRLVTRRYLDQATDNDLSRVYHYRGGDRSGTWILGHILVEESQHTVSPKAMARWWSQSNNIMCMKMTMLGSTTLGLPS